MYKYIYTCKSVWWTLLGFTTLKLRAQRISRRFLCGSFAQQVLIITVFHVVSALFVAKDSTLRPLVKILGIPKNLSSFVYLWQSQAKPPVNPGIPCLLRISPQIFEYMIHKKWTNVRKEMYICHGQRPHFSPKVRFLLWSTPILFKSEYV